MSTNLRIDKKKYYEALEIVNERYPGEEYDDSIYEKMKENGIQINDKMALEIKQERQSQRKKGEILAYAIEVLMAGLEAL